MNIKVDFGMWDFFSNQRSWTLYIFFSKMQFLLKPDKSSN